MNAASENSLWQWRGDIHYCNHDMPTNLSWVTDTDCHKYYFDKLIAQAKMDVFKADDPRDDGQMR